MSLKVVAYSYDKAAGYIKCDGKEYRWSAEMGETSWNLRMLDRHVNVNVEEDFRCAIHDALKVRRKLTREMRKEHIARKLYRIERLDGWSKIAEYLGLSASAAMGKEHRKVLPLIVHREVMNNRVHVFAFISELGIWQEQVEKLEAGAT